MIKRKFSILVLVVIIFNFNSSKCDTSEAVSKCCANTTNQRVFVEFSSNVVQHEFIVQFKDYFQAEARAKFLKAAIDNTDVSLP